MAELSLVESVAILSTVPTPAWLVIALFLVLVLMRNGILTYRASMLEGQAYENLSDELERLRRENVKFMAKNVKLIAFATHVLEHFGNCVDCPSQGPSREKLRAELLALVEG